MVPPVYGGVTKKKKWTTVYPNIPSALHPVLHGEGISVPEPPKEFTIDSDEEDEGESPSGSPEPPASTEPRLPRYVVCATATHSHTGQTERSCSRLELSKSKAVTGIKDSNNGIFSRKCPNFFVSQSSSAVGAFFRTEDDLVFCYDVHGPMNAPGIKHDPQEWRLFIDSSKLSLKAVLLHNGNQHPSIPVGHAVHMKETYENLKQLRNKLAYSKYGWHICGDLKAVSRLMDLQLGCTKYCCFYVNGTAEQRFCIT